MHKYLRVAQEIYQNIEKNDLKHGDKLPTVKQLMEEYGASKSTIISALDMLNKNGIIYQVRGSGIFVRRVERKGYINLSTRRGVARELKDFEVENDIIKNELITPDESLRYHLEISNPDTKVQYINRVTYINSQILVVEHSYYNNDLIPWMDEDIIHKSIFDHIMNDLDIRINYSNKFFRVVKLNEENAELMKQEKGDPAILFEEYYYMNDGTPFDYSNMYYNHEVAQFFMFSDNVIPN
ncbi:GntR family transcriptional regulator [Aerococcaceae bacterium DSM 111176]|nr:GntR family transcriptional regulator [Aerococcaceae bacterium DSM 111176]